MKDAIKITGDNERYTRWFYSDANDNLVSIYAVDGKDTTDYSSSVPTTYIYKKELTGTAIGEIDTDKSFAIKAISKG